MAWQAVPGSGIWYPSVHNGNQANVGGTGGTITATGQHWCQKGRIYYYGYDPTKTIQSVGFRFDAVTKSNGSALRVSLQNLATDNTAVPGRPDGNPLASFMIPNDDPDFIAQHYFAPTHPFDTPLPVTLGQILGVVIEPQPYNAGDSIRINGANGTMSLDAVNDMVMNPSGTTWNGGSSEANIIFQFDDGTIGVFDTCFANSFAITPAVATIAFNNTSSPSEYALRFQLPFPCKIDGISASCSIAGTTSAFNVTLYDGADFSVMHQHTVDSHHAVTLNGRPSVLPLDNEYLLEANHVYAIGIAPTTANNITIVTYEVATNDHFSVASLGTNGYMLSRTGNGAWTETKTRRIFASVRISALQDGTGDGGGGGTPPAGGSGGDSAVRLSGNFLG